jgi:hypothetical protein
MFIRGAGGSEPLDTLTAPLAKITNTLILLGILQNAEGKNSASKINRPRRQKRG